MFKEQLDNMIREAVYGAIEKMGIDVSFKDLPNASKLEKLLEKQKNKPETESFENIDKLDNSQ